MSGARFVPNISPANIPHGPERDVAKALERDLNAEWMVYHSYCWLREERNRSSSYLTEGEADFVLLHRTLGLLILEVKGGVIRFDPDQGFWWQNNHTMKDPFHQAQRNVRALVGQIEGRSKFMSGGSLPCPFGHSVVFPDGNFSGSLPPGAHDWITFSASDLQKLGEKVVYALKQWSRSSNHRPLHPQDYESIKKALQSTFRIVVSLAREIERDEDVLIQLTKQQAEALENIYANDRVLIEGTAGSRQDAAGHRARPGLLGGRQNGSLPMLQPQAGRLAAAADEGRSRLEGGQLPWALLRDVQESQGGLVPP